MLYTLSVMSMKKFRKVVLVLLVLLITGCGKKESITSDSFKEIMKDNDFYILDSKEQFSEYDYIKEALIAASSSDYQVEFYVLQDDKNALAFYKYNKEIFEASKEEFSVYSNVDFDTNNKYTLVTEDKYKVISRIKNTVIYADVDKQYKKDVNKIIKKLGY